MRICARRASACTRSPLVSSTRTRASRLGAAAYRSGTTSTTLNASSAIAGRPVVRRPAAGRQVGEEPVEESAGLLPAVEPPPHAAERAHQLVAAVDRDEEAGTLHRPARHPHDQRFHVGDEGAEDRALVQHPRPGAERQLALRGTGGGGGEAPPAGALRNWGEESP